MELGGIFANSFCLMQGIEVFANIDFPVARGEFRSEHSDKVKAVSSSTNSRSPELNVGQLRIGDLS